MKRMLFLCLILSGCATANTVGSGQWHNSRLEELREARTKNQISTEKYLEMKADADKIRHEFLQDRERSYYKTHHYYRPRFGYGFGYHTGCHH